MNQEHYDAITKAADLFASMVKAVLATEQGIHAESIVVSASRMAGVMLFRSFGISEDLTPGTAVISEQANVAGPQLFNVVLSTLKLLGHSVTDESMRSQTDITKQSHYSLLETQRRLDPFIATYCRVASMSFGDVARALSIAVAAKSASTIATASSSSVNSSASCLSVR